MPVSVIVGGQYGSEGKGKVAHFFANELNASAVIRIGGPNSGHTVISADDEALVFKHLPTACIIGGVKCILTAGNYINTRILLEEITTSGISEDELLIDPYAVIITDQHQEREEETGLVSKIGSTGAGVGAAILEKIARTSEIAFAKDVPELARFIGETNPYLRNLLAENKRVLIEGTQGFGLSNTHSNLYPYCTSRDTTAAGFVSEAGLSPLDVDEIILVIRAFPIRVAGNSGPLANETTWEKISFNSGSNRMLQEFTSVSKKLRRVAEFDTDVVNRAIAYNNPTKIVLNHVDYVGYTDGKFERMSDEVRDFLIQVESGINRKIDYVGLDRKTLCRAVQIEKKLVF